MSSEGKASSIVYVCCADGMLEIDFEDGTDVAANAAAAAAADVDDDDGDGGSGGSSKTVAGGDNRAAIQASIGRS